MKALHGTIVRGPSAVETVDPSATGGRGRFQDSSNGHTVRSQNDVGFGEEAADLILLHTDRLSLPQDELCETTL